MTKAELRHIYKEKRASLSPQTIEDYSIAIANQLLELCLFSYRKPKGNTNRIYITYSTRKR